MSHLSKLLCLSVLCFTLNNYAQKGGFEGTVAYSMDVDMKDMPPEAAAMMKNSEMVVQIKNEHTRTETKTAMSKSISISDNKNQTSFTLLDMMGSKYMIKAKPEEIKEDASRPDVKVKEMSETKIVAGYKCKKAEITMVDPKTKKEMNSTIFYTTELPYTKGYGTTYKGLKGFPLEYVIHADAGMQIKVTAKSVLQEKLDDKIFVAPADYKVVTAEELQSEMMKSFGGGEK